MRNLLVIVGISALILMTTQLFLPANAQIGLVESRLSRVESDLVGIRAELSQLSANRPRAGVSVPTPSTLPIPSRPSKFTDAQFDRLATLVIESRDRIKALEERVAKLEKR
ncbi:MAG: accessory factor UbiK family protein [Plectolyngbya sp. WJT66-NPBG17]|jgi:hypothetical protein|nr:accessory factor UbiK family protein [Plectolyngbya sp. WJT66-NPBG17]MBW4524451.1 accessory factor UbiK family protein [Phormidium tanganyikae FI6-MK23]